MTQMALDIIQTFDSLPKNEQQEVTKLILRRALEKDLPALSDDELTLTAEELFLELDKRETEDAES